MEGDGGREMEGDGGREGHRHRDRRRSKLACERE